MQIVTNLCGGLCRQERDVELAEDVSEQGIAGEVQQPLVLRVISGKKIRNQISKAAVVVRAPQLDKICELDRGCL